MKLTLTQKRAIVDRFQAGETLSYLTLDLWSSSDEKHIDGVRQQVEDVIRWSHNSKVERRRVWRRITRAGRK